MKKANWFERILCTIGILFMLWFAVSWVDIIADNTMPNPTHADWNMFVILFQE